MSAIKNAEKVERQERRMQAGSIARAASGEHGSTSTWYERKAVD